MDAQELRNLQEAYMEVVMNELDEGYKPLPTDRIKNKASRLAKDTLRDAGTTLNPFKSAGEKSEAKSNMEKRQKRVDKMVSILKDKTQKEEVDSFEEGYKVRNAAKIMNKKDSLRSSGNLEKLGRAGDIERKLYRRDFSAQNPDVEERLNKTRSDKRSKLVSDNSTKKKSFPNRLRRSDGQGIRDSYDYYNIILSHLLDEGYAETPEAAEAIMVNMSEEWRQSIIG